jgi:hypothetical protein
MMRKSRDKNTYGGFIRLISLIQYQRTAAWGGLTRTPVHVKGRMGSIDQFGRREAWDRLAINGDVFE